MSLSSAVAPARPAGSLETGVRIIGNETAKGLRIVWTDRAMQIAAVASMLGFYLAVQYLIGGGRILDALVVETAPGLFAYAVAYVASMRLVSGILEERNAGTLEQSHLGPLPSWLLVIGRLAAAMIEAVVVAGVSITIVLAVRGVGYALAWNALVPVGLALAGIAGFALLLGAASFTFPGIGALVHIIQMIVLALNGTIVPSELFPRWLEIIAKLVPSTLGVGATRSVLLDGHSLGDLWQTGVFGWLVLHTVMLVVLGWVAYQGQVRRALRDGRLGPV